ncbi:hypothetical protein [Nocardia nepalensis]|uniref:hypothetical protein n=1 Tax=Nocardia nepalensis TaxID=3375448 RepID=UPI003B676374
MSGGYWQYINGKWEHAWPDKKGYYYMEQPDKMGLFYYDGKEKKPIQYYDRKVVDADGNLHDISKDDPRISTDAHVTKESSGKISDQKITGFDPPTPKPVDENKLPAVKDRPADHLLAGEKLAAPGSKDVTDGNARSSITNGDYTLTLDKDNKLILTNKTNGNELWGYAGSDAADLLKNAIYDVQLEKDGSVKLIDPKTKEVVKVLREAGDTPHAELILLYHPPEETLKLRKAIDEGQKALQLQVDCFAKGRAELAKDVGDWLHNHGLADKENTSSLTLSYNESYLDYDTRTKVHFKDLDEKIRSIAKDTEQVNSAAFKKIMTDYEELDRQLRAVDPKTQVETVLIDRPEGVSPYTWAHVPSDDKHQTRIIPGVETRLIDTIDKTVQAVDKIVDDAKQKMSENEDEAGKESPEYKKGKEAGYKAGYEAGVAAGQKNNNNNNSNNDNNNNNNNSNAENNAIPTDWSGSFKDLLTGGEKGGANDTAGTAQTTTTGGSANPNAAALSMISAAKDKILATAKPSANRTSGGSSGGGSNSGAANANQGNSFASMMQQMQMMNLLQSLTKDKSKDHSRDSEHGSRNRDRYRTGDERAAQTVQAAQAAAANPLSMTQTGVVSATATTPPAIVGGGAMVDMRLPDGSNQKVTSSVAQAVNQEFNNPNGSNGKAAYPGSQWTTVGSSELHTGDVVEFTNNRSALVVMQGQEPHIIVNGELVKLDTHQPPSGYGAFAGFLHPSGADVNGTGIQQASTPAAPGAVTAPPTAPAAPPTVAAPAAT